MGLAAVWDSALESAKAAYGVVAQAGNRLTAQAKTAGAAAAILAGSAAMPTDAQAQAVPIIDEAIFIDFTVNPDQPTVSTIFGNIGPGTNGLLYYGLDSSLLNDSNPDTGISDFQPGIREYLLAFNVNGNLLTFSNPNAGAITGAENNWLYVQDQFSSEFDLVFGQVLDDRPSSEDPSVTYDGSAFFIGTPSLFEGDNRSIAYSAIQGNFDDLTNKGLTIILNNTTFTGTATSFEHISTVPELTSVALVFGAAAGGAALLLRRRRDELSAANNTGNKNLGAPTHNLS